MSTQTNLDLQRVANQIDVVLTQIFRSYVSKGCPTKLGGLRFLDLESSKTFAFEKTAVSENGLGNVLLFSAPYANIDQDKDPTKAKITDQKVVQEDAIAKAKVEIINILSKGPHNDAIETLNIRASNDRNKSDRFFIDVGYYVPTSELLSDEAIIAYAKEHNISTSREVIVRILEEKVKPMAEEIMDFLTKNLHVKH